MLWLLDWYDYGFVATDIYNKKEDYRTDIDPGIAKIEDVIFIDSNISCPHKIILSFADNIYLRRFYWEDFENIYDIYGSKCIFSGNKFYIIDNNSNRIKTHGNYRGYNFRSKDDDIIKLIEDSEPINLRNKSDNTLTNYWLHHVFYDLSDMDLPNYYYNNPRINHERIIFTDYKQIIKFIPTSESYVFDQYMPLNNSNLDNAKIIRESFIQKLYTGKDYRFPNAKLQNDENNGKTGEDEKDEKDESIINNININSSACALMVERFILGYKIMQQANKINDAQIILDILKSTNDEIKPSLCNNTNMIFKDILQKLNILDDVMNIFYNYADYIIRPILFEKYLFLLNKMHEKYFRFGTNYQYDIEKIKYDFSVITGKNAKIPIYNTTNLQWGGSNFGQYNISKNEQQMNRIGRLWQFILNPIIIIPIDPFKLANLNSSNKFDNFNNEYIRVKNLIYEGNGINYSNIDNNNVLSFWNYLEHILCDYFESFIKQELRQIDFNNYVLLGGKGINNIINISVLKKSFDFDIHIIDAPNNYALKCFGNKLCTKLNETFKLRSDYRRYLVNILKKNELIDDEVDYEHIVPFYFGARYKSEGFLIEGIFFRLPLKIGIFTEPYTNKPDNKDNEIYYPIIDLDYEKILNFGMEINNNKQIKIYDGIKYPIFAHQIFNLIRYIDQSEENDHKRQKNLNKLKQIFDIKKYTCTFISNNTKKELIESNKYINKRFALKYNLDYKLDLKNKTFNIGKRICDIYRILSEKLITSYSRIHENCKNNLILRHDIKDNPFIPGLSRIKIDKLLNHCIQIISEFDINQIDELNKCIYLYTSGAYKPLNIFEQYQYFGLATNDIPKYGSYNDREINEHTAKRINDTISRNIYNINNAYELHNIKDNMPVYFYTYRLQSNVYINLPKSQDAFSVSQMIRDQTLIYMPTFVSSSYSRNFNYDTFLNETEFVMRIRVHKDTKKWIIVDNYSMYPEKEVLFDKGCYFLIRDFTYLPVQIKIQDNSYKTFLTLDVDMFDDEIDLKDRMGKIIAEGSDHILSKHYNMNSFPEIKNQQFVEDDEKSNGDDVISDEDDEISDEDDEQYDEDDETSDEDEEEKEEPEELETLTLQQLKTIFANLTIFQRVDIYLETIDFNSQYMDNYKVNVFNNILSKKQFRQLQEYVNIMLTADLPLSGGNIKQFNVKSNQLNLINFTEQQIKIIEKNKIFKSYKLNNTNIFFIDVPVHSAISKCDYDLSYILIKEMLSMNYQMRIVETLQSNKKIFIIKKNIMSNNFISPIHAINRSNIIMNIPVAAGGRYDDKHYDACTDIYVDAYTQRYANTKNEYMLLIKLFNNYN